MNHTLTLGLMVNLFSMVACSSEDAPTSTDAAVQTDGAADASAADASSDAAAQVDGAADAGSVDAGFDAACLDGAAPGLELCDGVDNNCSGADGSQDFRVTQAGCSCVEGEIDCELSCAPPQRACVVVVGNDGTLLAGDLVLGLQESSTPLPGGVSFRDVAWGSGRFVALAGNQTVYLSEDAVNWRAGTSFGDRRLRRARYLDGRFYLLGEEGALIYSSDGLSWTELTLNTSLYLSDIAGDSSRLVITTNENAIVNGDYFRGDGTIFVGTVAGFSKHNTGVTDRGQVGIAWSGTRFVAADGAGQVSTSTDGVAWTRTTVFTPTPGVLGNATREVLYAFGRFIVDVPAIRRTYASPDGLSWQQNWFLNTGQLRAASDGERVFLITSDRAYFSCDGVQFDSVPIGPFRSGVSGVATANIDCSSTGR